MTEPPAAIGAERRARKARPPSSVSRSRPGAVASAIAPMPKTLAGRLRMQISDEIVRGMLAPGVALDEMELARRFDVSRTPVCEAIRLLVASGLVYGC